MLAAHSDSYVLGIDPGARNLGVAATNNSIGECVDLGALLDTPIQVCVANAVRALTPLIRAPSGFAVAIEEQLVAKFNEKAAVAARLFAVQGALQACCMVYGKPLYLVSPSELKRHFNWKFMGGYNANKLWCIGRCRELWPEWYNFSAKAQNDHACDAKLLAEYLKTRLCNEQAGAAQDTGQAAP
jgi:Holliday junction resolvasome RuvABC endonuclease subunit